MGLCPKPYSLYEYLWTSCIHKSKWDVVPDPIKVMNIYAAYETSYYENEWRKLDV